MRIKYNGREPSGLEYVIIIVAIALIVMCACVAPIWLIAGGVGAWISKELGFNPWLGVAVVGLLILLGGVSVRWKS